MFFSQLECLLAIWTREANLTIDIIEAFHYVLYNIMIKKQRKLQIQGHNFSQAYRRHNLGVPFYHRGKFYNWYYLSFSLCPF